MQMDGLHAGHCMEADSDTPFYSAGTVDKTRPRRPHLLLDEAHHLLACLVQFGQHLSSVRTSKKGIKATEV